MLPGTGGEGEEGRGTEKGGGDGGELEEVEKRSGGLGAEKGKGEGVPALPLQLIQRNRLSTEQIKQLPRFKDYSPGRPTSVSPSSLPSDGVTGCPAGAVHQEPSS